MKLRFSGILGAVGLASLLVVSSPARAVVETYALNVNDGSTPLDSVIGTISIDTSEAPYSFSQGLYFFSIQSNVQLSGPLFSGSSVASSFYTQSSTGGTIVYLVNNLAGSVGSVSLELGRAITDPSIVSMTSGPVSGTVDVEFTIPFSGTLTQEVPEPASLGLFGFALAGLACGRQTRRRRMS